MEDIRQISRFFAGANETDFALIRFFLEAGAPEQLHRCRVGLFCHIEGAEIRLLSFATGAVFDRLLSNSAVHFPMKMAEVDPFIELFQSGISLYAAIFHVDAHGLLLQRGVRGGVDYRRTSEFASRMCDIEFGDNGNSATT